jgi:hypothetical protein
MQPILANFVKGLTRRDGDFRVFSQKASAMLPTAPVGIAAS